MIGSAKLAAEAVDVMEIDFDDDFDEDNWDDVQSLLPSGGAPTVRSVGTPCGSGTRSPR